jgi:hypothetical protein
MSTEWGGMMPPEYQRPKPLRDIEALGTMPSGDIAVPSYQCLMRTFL